MNYQPLIPLSGIPGWRILERTQPTQQKAFENSAQIKRDIAYFEKNIASVKTAADLVADRRLLTVALGAFGLEGEVDKKAFIRKILEGGTDGANSLANRLVASGMKDFARTFGFGNAGGSQIGSTGFTAKIVAAYKTRGFEAAVGNTNNDLRLALNFKREMTELSNAALRRAHDDHARVTGATDYFAANIGRATTAAALVADTGLLKVALTAFGLAGAAIKTDDLRRALEGGTDVAGSIANTSKIPGLREFVKAFGYGDAAGAQILAPGLTKKVVADYKTQAFDILLNQADKGSALAVRFKADLAARSTNEGGGWYSVLSSKPMRTVLETALNLPSQFLQLDIDRQHAIVVEGVKKITGSDKIGAFTDPKIMQKMINRFLVMSQIKESSVYNNSFATALTLVQNIRAGSQGLSNLFASNA